jgi:transcriptional regulator with XRE-family HTH domain
VTRPDTSASAGPELIGPLLARLRNGRGWSQLRLADTLCQVTGRITVTRHEVSRWERAVRLPGPFWLDALAVALQTPRRELDAAVARHPAADSRPGRTTGRAAMVVAATGGAGSAGRTRPPHAG